MCPSPIACSSKTSYETEIKPKTSTPKHKTYEAILEQPNKVKLSHPEYTIYADEEIIMGSKAGQMSDDARKRLVRGVIDNMVSAAAAAPFCRRPYRSELEEMAKSLVVTYPWLRDAETGHVSYTNKNICRTINNSTVCHT